MHPSAWNRYSRKFAHPRSYATRCSYVQDRWASGAGENEAWTVADLFADPPDWLVTQLTVYHEDPARHLKPLCTPVAAVVLGEGLRGDEVREEVERELATITDS